MTHNLREAMYAILYAEGEELKEEERIRGIRKAIDCLNMELNEEYGKTKETPNTEGKIRCNMYQEMGEKALKGIQDGMDTPFITRPCLRYFFYEAAKEDFEWLLKVLDDTGRITISDLKLCSREKDTIPEEDDNWGWEKDACSLRLVRKAYHWEIIIPESPKKLEHDGFGQDWEWRIPYGSQVEADSALNHILHIIWKYGCFTAEEFKTMKIKKMFPVKITEEDKKYGWISNPNENFGFSVKQYDGDWWLVAEFYPSNQNEKEYYWDKYFFNTFDSEDKVYPFLNAIKNMIHINDQITVTELKCICESTKYTYYKEENTIGWKDPDDFWIAKLPDGNYEVRIRVAPKPLESA